LEDIDRHAGHKVLMEVDDNRVVIISNPLRTLDEQFMPNPVHLLNIIIVAINYIKLYIITLLKYLKTENRHANRRI
jgi:hypothetical protein